MHIHDLRREVNVKGDVVYRCTNGCDYAEDENGNKIKGVADL